MVDLSRRNALQGLAMLPLAASMARLHVQPRRRICSAASRTLVAFFSRTGNTRVIAGQIRRAHSADIFEIVPATPYPEDYQETVSQAQRERDSGFEPPLRETVRAIAAYSIVFLGFPIWGIDRSVQSSVLSFRATTWQEKRSCRSSRTVGTALAAAFRSSARMRPQARLIEGFALEADQERRTLEQVTGWLGGLPL